MPINDPVLWYKLDETTGTSSADSGSAGIALTWNLAPTWTAGAVGNAAQLATSGNIVGNLASAMSSPVAMDTGTWSVGFWAQPNGTAQSQTFGNTMLLTDSGVTAGWQIGFNRSGTSLTVLIFGGGTVWGGSLGAWADLELAHWLLTYNNGAWVIYKNGASVASGSTTAPAINLARIRFGDWNSSGGGEPFRGGLLDEVRYFTRTLDATEAAALYAYTASGATDQPEGQESHDDGQIIEQHLSWALGNWPAYDPSSWLNQPNVMAGVEAPMPDASAWEDDDTTAHVWNRVAGIDTWQQLYEAGSWYQAEDAPTSLTLTASQTLVQLVNDTSLVNTTLTLTSTPTLAQLTQAAQANTFRTLGSTPTLDQLTQTTAVSVGATLSLTASQTLDQLTQAASSQVGRILTGAGTLDQLTQAATLATTLRLNATQTLVQLTQSAAVYRQLTLTSGPTLAQLTQLVLLAGVFRTDNVVEEVVDREMIIQRWASTTRNDATLQRMYGYGLDRLRMAARRNNVLADTSRKFLHEFPDEET